MLIVGYSVLSFSSVVPAGSNSRAVRAIDAAKAAVSLFATPRAISKDVHCQWTSWLGCCCCFTYFRDTILSHRQWAHLERLPCWLYTNVSNLSPAVIEAKYAYMSSRTVMSCVSIVAMCTRDKEGTTSWSFGCLEFNAPAITCAWPSSSICILSNDCS